MGCYTVFLIRSWLDPEKVRQKLPKKGKFFCEIFHILIYRILPRGMKASPVAWKFLMKVYNKYIAIFQNNWIQLWIHQTA